MNTLDFAVLCAIILLFALGIRALLTKTEEGDPSPMGCGYGMIAGALLAYQFSEQAGGFFNGIRLGIGFALILPGIKAVLSPKGRNLGWAVMTFLLAILVAAEPVQHVYRNVSGAPVPITIEARLEQMESSRPKLANFYDLLGSKEVGLKAKIRELGTDKAAVLAHPEAQDMLAQLQATLQRRREITAKLAELDLAIADLRVELEQLKLAGKAGNFDHEDPRFRNILLEIEATTAEAEGGTIEQYMLQAELEQLYEDEF
ncbi:MAG: hypothetical protein ACI8QC_000265 [Planctomycetota bacterium]|jgi:hypothetical protein